MEKIKNSKFQIRLPIILTVGLAAGIMIGATFAGSDQSVSNFMKSVMKFREVMSLIDRSYVDDVNTDEMVETAVAKMLEDLDPHTVYMSAKEVERTATDLKKMIFKSFYQPLIPGQLINCMHFLANFIQSFFYGHSLLKGAIKYF